MLLYLRSLAIGALAVVGFAAAANAAVNVGALSTIGETITGSEIYFGRYNSVSDSGGLEFTVGTAGEVLFSVQGLTPSTAVSIIGSGGSFATATGTGSGSFLSALLSPGDYAFTVSSSAVSRAAPGGVLYNLTLTPIPGAVALLGPALAGIGYLGYRRRKVA